MFLIGDDIVMNILFGEDKGCVHQKSRYFFLFWELKYYMQGRYLVHVEVRSVE